VFGQYAAVLGNVFCRIRSWYVFILMYSIELVTYWAHLGAHKCLARPSCDPCHEFHCICSISAKPRSWPNRRVNGVSAPYSHVFRDGWEMHSYSYGWLRCGLSATARDVTVVYLLCNCSVFYFFCYSASGVWLFVAGLLRALWLPCGYCGCCVPTLQPLCGCTFTGFNWIFAMIFFK
jgi:hypothetical protein